MKPYNRYNNSYSNKNRYQNNNYNRHDSEDESDYVYTRAEVEKNLILCNRIDFSYKKFEVYKAYVVFSDDPNSFKSRPIIVVRDNGDTVTCLKCTSKRYRTDNYWEKCPVEDWIYAGFTKPSYIILKEKLEINKRFIFKRIGKLKSEDIQNLQEIGL